MVLSCFSQCLDTTIWLATELNSFACGTHFAVDHALSCPKGGLRTSHHNEIRDLTATLLNEVCCQVQVEPELQPVSSPETFSLLTANSQY